MPAQATAGDPPLASDVPDPGSYGARHQGATLCAVPEDGLGWSRAELAELGQLAPGLQPGRIVKADRSGALVLTLAGAARATYCAQLLLAAARAHSAGRVWPRPGDRVALRRWPDGPITVEGVVTG
jgi:hypothetical protein